MKATLPIGFRLKPSEIAELDRIVEEWNLKKESELWNNIHNRTSVLRALILRESRRLEELAREAMESEMKPAKNARQGKKKTEGLVTK